jgi:CO/xanthine dehydrogenase Mo-binding subunit
MGSVGFRRAGHESARVVVHADGRATVFSGAMSTGQGHATSLAQVAMPMTPMHVWRAIERAREGRDGLPAAAVTGGSPRALSDTVGAVELNVKRRDQEDA